MMITTIAGAIMIVGTTMTAAAVRTAIMAGTTMITVDRRHGSSLGHT